MLVREPVFPGASQQSAISERPGLDRIAYFIGNTPNKMVALLALRQLDPDELAIPAQLGRLANDLQGPNLAKDYTPLNERNNVFTHCKVSLNQMGLVRFGKKQGSRGPTAAVGLSERGAIDGLTVAGALFRPEFHNAEDPFLVDVLGDWPRFADPSGLPARLLAFEELLNNPDGKLPIAQLKKKNNFQLAKELCSKGIWEQPVPGIVCLSPRYKPFVKKLLRVRDLLISDSDEGRVFRVAAKDYAKNVLLRPESGVVYGILAAIEQKKRPKNEPAATPKQRPKPVSKIAKTSPSASLKKPSEPKRPSLTVPVTPPGWANRLERLVPLPPESISAGALHRLLLESSGVEVSFPDFYDKLSTIKDLDVAAITEDGVEGDHPESLSRVSHHIHTFPVDWSNEGLCRYVDPDIFTPEGWGHQESKAAKKICHTCPVKLACLKAAIDRDERYSICGGVWFRHKKRELSKWMEEKIKRTVIDQGSQSRRF